MIDLTSLKPTVWAACRAAISTRIAELESGIADARVSMQSDTKSSAGDKHETARAMAQLEVDKLASALANMQAMAAVLDRIDPHSVHVACSEGSLLRTDRGVFYIAVGLGRLRVNDMEVQVISAQAPLALLLRHAHAGSSATFNERVITVLQVA